MRRFIDQTRNDMTHMVCNFFINHVAVGQYRDFLRTIYGMGVQKFEEEFLKKYEQTQEEGEL